MKHWRNLHLQFFGLNIFLSQHFTKCGNNEKAIEYIDWCIDHTPTVVELYLAKAKIYKNIGDKEKACEFVEEARSLDLADKFLNTLSIKYLLRANKVEEARALLSIYTKLEQDDTNQAINNVVDMQVTWYEQEEALCWIRKGELGKAIRKLKRIEKHFLDFIEDQFPYHIHSYCFNKMTLSAYYKFIKFEDNILGHKYYVKAAKSLVRCYLELFDNPDKYQLPPEEDIPPKEEKVNPTPKRGGRTRGRGRGNKTNTQPQHVEPKKEEKEKNMEEEESRKLLSQKHPIKLAMVQLERLLTYSNDFETNSLAFEVYMRRKKYLLALKSLVKMSKLNPDNPTVTESLNKFKTEVSNEKQKELIENVIKIGLEELETKK